MEGGTAPKSDGERAIDGTPSAAPDDDAGFDLGHAVTSRLGLERIEPFSLRAFFGGVFARRSADHVEDHLSVGFRGTTPALDPAMARMPSPWLFGRCLFVTLLVFVPLYAGLVLSGSLILLPGVILVGAFAVPISTLVLFFELNTPRNVSVTRVTFLFIAGAALSLLLSVALYEYMPLLGLFGAPAAGLIEELGKLGALALIVRRYDPRRYPFALNGLLFGAAVGAGFAAFETAGYALVVGLQEGGGEMLEVLRLRGLFSPFAHIVWTAAVGCVYWRSRAAGASLHATLRSPVLQRVLGAAMLLHAVWNLPIQLPFGALRVAVGVISWIIVISLVQSGLREVGRAAAARAG